MNLFVEDSHARCRLNGIKPESVYSTRMLEGKELEKKMSFNKELVLTAAPFLSNLYDFVKGSNFLAI